jgi:hypothetical protein
MELKIKSLPEGWFSDADISTYKALADSIAYCSVIVELGVWKGRSICSIAETVIKKNHIVLAIDTFEGTENEGNAHAEAKVIDLKEEFTNNVTEYGLNRNLHSLHIIKSRTDDKSVLDNWKNSNNIRLVFIDADHSVEAVREDIKNWLPLLQDEGWLAGHDYSWASVREALESLNLLHLVKVNGDIWHINAGVAKENMKEVIIMNVHCVVNTCDRYFSTLPLCLMSIISQTVKPQSLIVYDDSVNEVNLANEPMYLNLFHLLDKSGIHWKFVKTPQVGQVVNHQDAWKNSPYDLVWRVDDDLIVDSECLEILKCQMLDQSLGAVAPLIITRTINITSEDGIASNLMDNIESSPNLQWLEDLHTPIIVDEVEHLHCSFLYSRKAFPDGYNMDLSKVGHREETLFTYLGFKKGAKLGVANVKCYHLKEQGGIRNPSTTKEMFEQDERIFRNFIESFTTTTSLSKAISFNDKQKAILPLLSELSIENRKQVYIFLNCGLGDHLAFKNVFSRKANPSVMYHVSCCWPDVFKGINNIRIFSISKGLEYLNKMGQTEDLYNVYKYMYDHRLENLTLEAAFARLYFD